jgi:protein-L-isoaspartate O-methyltransferase
MTPASVRSLGVEVPLQDRFSAVIREHLASGKYERAECDALDRLLVDGDRVLELGTGLGLVAVRCAQRLGSDRVATVEADPEMLAVIVATCEANHVSPSVLIGAVSADGGDRWLERAPHLWSTKAHPPLPAGAPPVNRQLVGGTKLSALVEWHRPSVLMVDIEGGESHLGPTDLPGVRAVLIECHSRADKLAVDAWLIPLGFGRSGDQPTRLRLYERTPHDGR